MHHVVRSSAGATVVHEASTGVEKGTSLVAAANGEVLLLEHMDYRGVIPVEGGTPITCLLALTKARRSRLLAACVICPCMCDISSNPPCHCAAKKRQCT
jgi:hypothetical protein